MFSHASDAAQRLAFASAQTSKVRAFVARICTNVVAGLLLAASAAGFAHAQATLTISTTTASAGASVTASWSGIAAGTGYEWIGLHLPGTPSQSYIDWIYVSCSRSVSGPRASGNCLFTLPSSLASGTYELRLHADRSWTTIAPSRALNVTGGAGGTGVSLSATPSSAAAGATITASWNGIPGSTGLEWIGLHSPGTPSSAYIDWIYVSCSKSANGPHSTGNCAFALPGNLAAGTYELRLHSSSSWDRIATSGALSVAASGGGGGGGGSNLTVAAANAFGAPNIFVYPLDSSGRGAGSATFGRSYASNTRVWLSAPLRSGNNYFVKWQRNGVDFDHQRVAQCCLYAHRCLRNAILHGRERAAGYRQYSRGSGELTRGQHVLHQSRHASLYHLGGGAHQRQIYR
jgi:hypothetical protein